MDTLQDAFDAGVTRRSVLGLLGTATVGSVRASARGGSTEPSFVLEQAGGCVPMKPLVSDRSVEEFYDYRLPSTGSSGPGYSSHGTQSVQRTDTSILFLYWGPEGTSLVIVHDRYGDGTPGGSATFDIDGLPPNGEWVVRDDDYDEPSSYDIWQVGGSTCRIDWTWGKGRTDGGVFRGLDGETRFTIAPAFNGRAALAGQHNDGEITEWQALSGDSTDPDRFSLRMDEPITIRAGTC